MRLLSKVIDAGKGRTAAKCRSYLRAAYSLAIRSRTDPKVPLGMRAFGITANPIAGIDALAAYNRTRQRALSGPELAAFLKQLETLPAGAQRDALKLCLLLGGQRPVQLLRVRPADIDIAASTLTIYDAKGKRRQPRMHVVPLTAEASAILERRLRQLGEGEPLFSTDKQTAMRIETIPCRDQRGLRRRNPHAGEAARTEACQADRARVLTQPSCFAKFSRGRRARAVDFVQMLTAVTYVSVSSGPKPRPSPSVPFIAPPLFAVRERFALQVISMTDPMLEAQASDTALARVLETERGMDHYNITKAYLPHDLYAQILVGIPGETAGRSGESGQDITSAQLG